MRFAPIMPVEQKNEEIDLFVELDNLMVKIVLLHNWAKPISKMTKKHFSRTLFFKGIIK